MDLTLFGIRCSFEVKRIMAFHWLLSQFLSSLKGSGRLILSPGLLPCSEWLCILFTISSDNPQRTLLPFSMNSSIQWHGYLKYTHIHICEHTHTHIYLFLKQNLWEERKMICKWYLDIATFLNFRSLISEKEIWGPAQGCDVPINIRSWRELKYSLNSEVWKGMKEKVIPGRSR